MDEGVYIYVLDGFDIYIKKKCVNFWKLFMAFNKHQSVTIFS